MVYSRSSELACKSVYLYILIALCHLVRCESCSAARAVWQDLVSFVNESFIESVLDDPPAGFDIVILICDVWVFHVSKISHLLGHVGPHLSVLEYRFTALLVELLYAVLLNVLLAAETKLFFNFDLYRQTVSIPAALALYLETLHGLVSVNGILECPCHHMMDARLAVGCRRSFVEYE